MKAMKRQKTEKDTINARHLLIFMKNPLVLSIVVEFSQKAQM